MLLYLVFAAHRLVCFLHHHVGSSSPAETIIPQKWQSQGRCKDSPGKYSYMVIPPMCELQGHSAKVRAPRSMLQGQSSKVRAPRSTLQGQASRSELHVQRPLSEPHLHRPLVGLLVAGHVTREFDETGGAGSSEAPGAGTTVKVTHCVVTVQQVQAVRTEAQVLHAGLQGRLCERKVRVNGRRYCRDRASRKEGSGSYYRE